MLKKNKHNHWKSKYDLNEEASDFHNLLRDLLISGPFKDIKAYQEVLLKDLVEEDNSTQRIDWYIESLNICIELHGQQHYKETNFGNKDAILSALDFIGIKQRDTYKKNLLIQNGYLFIEIPYNDKNKLSHEYLINHINKAIEEI